MTTTSDVEEYREWLRRYDWKQPKLGQLAEKPDDDLTQALDGARDYIDGLRLSPYIVAANFLIDGHYRG